MILDLDRNLMVYLKENKLLSYVHVREETLIKTDGRMESSGLEEVYPEGYLPGNWALRFSGKHQWHSTMTTLLDHRHDAGKMARKIPVPDLMEPATTVYFPPVWTRVKVFNAGEIEWYRGRTRDELTLSGRGELDLILIGEWTNAKEFQKEFSQEFTFCITHIFLTCLFKNGKLPREAVNDIRDFEKTFKPLKDIL